MIDEKFFKDYLEQVRGKLGLDIEWRLREELLKMAETINEHVIPKIPDKKEIKVKGFPCRFCGEDSERIYFEGVHYLRYSCIQDGDTCSNIKKEKLLPCPFCGEVPKKTEFTWYKSLAAQWIWCQNYDYCPMAYTQKEGNLRKFKTHEWNRRA